VKKSKIAYMADSAGDLYPVLEAEHDMAFCVYRRDQKKGVVLDGFNCVEAKGMKRHRQIHDAYVSSGRVAYALINSAVRIDGKHWDRIWRRFILPKRAQTVRDEFEVSRAVKKQTLTLMAPSRSQTREGMRAGHKRWKDAGGVRSTAGDSTEARKNRTTRLQRLGVHHRKKPEMAKSLEA